MEEKEGVLCLKMKLFLVIQMLHIIVPITNTHYCLIPLAIPLVNHYSIDDLNDVGLPLTSK